MYILIICVVVFFSLVAIYFTKTRLELFGFLRFFAEGKDKGFTSSDLLLLWRTGSYAKIKDKEKLFWSVSALDDCIKCIARQVDVSFSGETGAKLQSILNQLYAYRTKVELEQVQKRRRLESTHEISPRQICIIIVPNENTVYAKLVANKKDSLIFTLFDASSERAKTVRWQGKPIRVYFWRQGDAGYIFSSTAINSRQTGDCMELSVNHSNKIVRTQKRKSVRASCNFEARLFPLHDTDVYTSKYQTSGGVKCVLNDISEDGAMVFARGKAAKGVRIRLQFKIKDIPIVMCGRIVRFMYDIPSNKSRIHFQCEFLDQKMKNVILSYVYNIASEDSNEFITSVFKEEPEDSENGLQSDLGHSDNMKLTDLEE